MPPAWYSHTESMGQRWSGGSMRRRLATGGIAGPGLVSVLKPNAPPWRVSRYQNEGATYSYAPVIFTPLGPTVVVLPAADEIEGFGQSNSCRIPKYIFSILGGGAKSLPYNQAMTEGWRSRRRIWSRSESPAIVSFSLSQAGQFSHWSQQHQPAITRMPIWSARSKKCSFSSLPSRRTALRLRSR